MLLAEDVLLLLTDDTSGRSALSSSHLELVLAGAVLLDLAILHRVDVTRRGHPVGAGRLLVLDETPTGDPLLDAALVRLAGRKPRRAKDSLASLSKHLRTAVLDRLAAAGLLRRRESRVLGIVTVTRWPAVDVMHKSELRAAVRNVLTTGRNPTDREAALVSLLSAVDQVPLVVGPTEVPRRELRRRAKSIAQGEFAGEAVRRAITEMNAAVAGAVTAATVAAAAGGA